MNEDTTITLNDFRSWLQGVEDMQEDGWIPNAVQWKKIRTKIDQIEEGPKPALMSSGPVFRGEMISGGGGHPSQSSLDTIAIPTIPPSNARLSTFMPPPTPVHLENPKTPDIDTSAGGYRAPYV